jgi:CheY-like chemotaxis protein
MASGLAFPACGAYALGDVMSANLTGIRVVVVEDHGDSREILEQMLGFYGAIVTTVSTASDALAIAPDADIIVTTSR